MATKTVQTTNDGVYIVKALRDFLNKKWTGKMCNIELEKFGKYPPSMMLQQLSGAFIDRKYVDGSYIGIFPFAIYVRVKGESTADTMDAIKQLNDLYHWLIEMDNEEEYINLPVLDNYTESMEFEMSSLPSIVERYSDGIEDYQAIFKLKYMKRRIQL